MFLAIPSLLGTSGTQPLRWCGCQILPKLQNALETGRMGSMGEGLVMIPYLTRVEPNHGTKTQMGEIGMGTKNGTVDQLERRIWR